MYNFQKPITLGWLSQILNIPFCGDGSFKIFGVANSNSPESNSLMFTKTTDLNIHDAVLIAPQDSISQNVLLSPNPRFDFIRALEVINSVIGFQLDDAKPQVHSSVKLGENVVIENGVFVGPNTVIESNVVINRGTYIGENCLIRSNTSIGGDGFGYEREINGKPIKFIHLGGVNIGNNVEVGSNTCIARGTLGNTLIEDNVKIDNLVHIAHNCIIRNGAFIIACSSLSGGVEIGRNAWVAPNATIIQKVKVGENAMVGLGSVVLKDVENGCVVAATPARLIRRPE
ncbi:UDP-3-O-[3-hydroxymyristoyl] glucosamine N-acyltransferase [Aequoribacter fuscus]|uniref:UDP-3-O-[3-hydroxymyristoyl] glucosamine N-acyltransferase n=1 Tax=Aequoribacter fuscus TaxID=2518989 RepID=F3L3Q8_9GAMM|nr:UDP-3-O-(3-hydroxymyristoyl)glucosamine N-acyltransferase [Aequoribacter fuscus]EGG29031.1 UDP-3-O-[3-hydroxymyristoyl] glucosamine N-acyltransferase [Aequoribacter fuscus]QHJ88885.1 UDP-3-O-(3-hydroxymyristoyl)glucosamine N-acyltransferase [Aequoribacter fuscus]